MTLFSNIFNHASNDTDSDTRLRKPLHQVYKLLGIFSFSLPVLGIYICLNLFNIYQYELMYIDGFPQFCIYLGMGLFVFACLLIGIYNFRYWKKRAENLLQEKTEGTQLAAITLFAHLLQSVTEIGAINYGLIHLTFGLIGYLFGYIPACIALAEYNPDMNAFAAILIGLLAVAIAIPIILILSFIGILFARFCGEWLRARAQMANDLRNMTDIQRAQTAPAPAPTQTEEPKPLEV